MRALLFVSASVLGVAQPFPNLGAGNSTSGYTWFGPKTVFPGFTSWYYFSFPNWRVPVTCSATGNTCDTAGSGYTPLGTETNVRVIATTVPSGMDTSLEGTWAQYKICNVNGTQFQLCQGATTTVETFSSTGSGVNLLIQRNDLGITYVVSTTGFPSGTTLKWWEAFSGGNGIDQAIQITANGNAKNSLNVVPLTLEADIPKNAPPGDYTVTLTTCTVDSAGGTCTGGVSDTLSWTVTVTNPNPPADSAGPTSFPAIPGLSTWEAYQTSAGTGGGSDWCNKTTGVTNPANLVAAIGTDHNINYYDGGLSYWAIANYQHDLAWQNCAANILQQVGWGNAQSSGSGYYIQNNGQIGGWRNFPLGYEKAFSQDARYLGVNEYLAGANGHTNAGVPQFVEGCSPNDNGIRENSYALDLFLALDRMGYTTAAFDREGGPSYQLFNFRMHHCADMAIQNLLYYVEGTDRYSINQYFFDGIDGDSLEHWWAKTHDPRVHYVLKAIADQYWSHYDQVNHVATWTPDPVGIHCSTTAKWFQPNVTGICGSGGSTQLHNLFVHIFAWLWRVDGNSAYQTEGDEVFSHSLDTIADKGKTFNQMYRYSFNYVCWRKGVCSPEKPVE